jgi:hypothetical protein
MPEMKKRVQKRLAETLVKEIRKPVPEETANLKRIQMKLTTKDPALSCAI